MEIDYKELYEKRNNDLCFEIYYIEGKKYNFKLEDIRLLLGIDDLELFKKYLYYLDIYRCTYLFSNSFEETIEEFKSVIDEENIKEKLVDMFIKHDNLFCDEKGVRRLSLVPNEYNKRIVNY